MTVGRIDEGDIEALALGVGARLLEAVCRRIALGFGLDEGDGDGLGFVVDFDAERVIDEAFRLAARAAVDDFDAAGRLFAADEVFRPATSVDGGVDEFGAGVGFGEGHGSSAGCSSRGRSAGCCDVDVDILQANPPKGNGNCVRESAQRCAVEGAGILHCQNDERLLNCRHRGRMASCPTALGLPARVIHWRPTLHHVRF